MRTDRERITAATCLTCGACCIAPYDQDSFADVTAKDEKRLGTSFVRRHVRRLPIIDQAVAAMTGRALPPGALSTKETIVKKGPIKSWTVTSCVALRGSPMHNVSCTIYARRPHVCRKAVVPGDRTCRQLRADLSRRFRED